MKMNDQIIRIYIGTTESCIFFIIGIQTSPPTSRKAASNKISTDKITITLPRKIILERMDWMYVLLAFPVIICVSVFVFIILMCNI
jgi:hypothetical protein